jgi:hypothetical protein
MGGVRINGQPRHKFVLGLGSQKDYERRGTVNFWVRVMRRIARYGLTEQQRRRLATEMVRKGARLPTVAERRESHWPERDAATSEEVARIVASLPNVSAHRPLVTTARHVRLTQIDGKLSGPGRNCAGAFASDHTGFTSSRAE